MSQFHSNGKNTSIMSESPFTANSNVQAGLIAVEKDTKEGRQTVFFTPTDPSGDEAVQEYDD